MTAVAATIIEKQFPINFVATGCGDKGEGSE